MPRSTPPTLLSLLVALAACGGATPEARDPAAATADAAPSASPAPAEPPGRINPDADSPDGVRRWASWDGPKSGTALTTKRAWVVAPSAATAGTDKLSFAAVELRLVEVVKADGDEVVFKDRKQTYAVPAALAWPAEAARAASAPARGSAVRCAFGGGSVVARVEAVDARSVTCAFRLQEKSRKEKMAAADVVRLAGKIEPGAPAIVRFGSDTSVRYRASVMAVSSDDVWVKVDHQFAEGDPRAGRAVHKMRAAGVEIIDVTRPLKVGEACLATDITGVVPCKVTRVIDGGLAYVVEHDGGSAGDRKEWTFDEVAPAPR